MKVVEEFLGDCNAFVELGSGAGSNVFQILDEFDQITSAACGDISPNGVSCTRMVRDRFDLNVSCFVHDHYDPNPDLMKQCKNAIVLTCQSIEQLPRTPAVLLDQLEAACPKIVIHLEPVNEHNFSNNRLLNIMRRQYTEINDYNRDLLTVLKKMEANGKIELVMNEGNIFGSNVMNPLSIIAWRPAG